jgi:hypothetical protein
VDLALLGGKLMRVARTAAFIAWTVVAVLLALVAVTADAQAQTEQQTAAVAGVDAGQQLTNKRRRRDAD